MRSRPVVVVLALALSAGGLAVGVAQDSAVPPPTWARSVEIMDEGTPVLVEPREGASRRGTVKATTRLPLRGRVAGSGCSTGVWFQVPGGYVCEQHARPSPAMAAGLPQPYVRPGRHLPHTYAFVGVDGTRAYARPSDYDADQYVEAFGEGFGLVVAGTRTWDGLRFVRTRRGLWVEREGLRFARGSDFAGVEIEAGAALDHAWVIRRDARVHERPRGRVSRRAARRALVHIAAAGPSGWVELRSGGFMRTRDLAQASTWPRPASVGPDERWIDVDVEEQVMVAWRGDRPIYATAVSTGRARRTHQTPLGEFRIWVKLATSDMDDLERADVEHNYSIENVPWVQFFEGSNGFHAAFWHDDFGRRRSHGCVNLSPADARWLFDWTAPHLPAGWTAVLPVEAEPGTLVRVREGAVSVPPATGEDAP